MMVKEYQYLPVPNLTNDWQIHLNPYLSGFSVGTMCACDVDEVNPLHFHPKHYSNGRQLAL